MMKTTIEDLVFYKAILGYIEYWVIFKKGEAPSYELAESTYLMLVDIGLLKGDRNNGK